MHSDKHVPMETTPAPTPHKATVCAPPAECLRPWGDPAPCWIAPDKHLSSLLPKTHQDTCAFPALRGGLGEENPAATGGWAEQMAPHACLISLFLTVRSNAQANHKTQPPAPSASRVFLHSFKAGGQRRLPRACLHVGRSILLGAFPR